MIKDSKIIGTKIVAPYGWKKFKVGELFDVRLSKSDNKINELSVGSIPLVSSGIENNGVVGYVSSDLLGLSPFKDSIVADMFGNWTVHEGDFYAVSHGRVNILEPNFVFSSFSCLFICSVGMKHTFGLYGFDNMLSSKKIKNIELDLPVTSTNKPDFAWMEQYMKLVQEDYLQQKKLSNQAEIKAYLTESQTDSLEITDADREFLHEFDKLPRRKFSFNDVFLSISRGDISNKESLVISGTKLNDKYVSFVQQSVVSQRVDKFVLDTGFFKVFSNSLIIGRQTGCVFYEPCDFVTTDGVLVLKSVDSTNKLFNLFLVTLVFKLLGSFGYTNTVSVSKLKALYLDLPVLSNSQVDMHSIEKYMRIQSKPLVNNVAETLAPVGGGNFN